MKKRYEINMTKGPLLPELLQFILPLMLSSMLQIAFNAADLIVVGRFGRPHSMAAVGANGAMINLIINVLMGLATGGGVLCARYYGANQTDKLHRTVSTTLITGVIGGVITGALGLALTVPLLRLVGSPDEVLPLATVYLRIYFLGLPVMALYNFSAAALRALGNTRQPLIYLAIAGVLNVIMNLFFVIVVGFDVAGVAIATVISQYVSVALILICLMRQTGPVLSQCVSGFLTVRCLLTSQEMHIKELHFSGHIFKKMMNIGIPAGIQGSLFSISNFIIQASVNSFGAAVIAGNSACVSVEGLLYCPSDAVMQAATTAVSQNVGAQEYERSRSVARWSMVLVVVLTGILTVPAVVFRRQVLGLYTSSEAELEAAFTRMMIVCLTYSLDGTMAAMSGVNRGLGYSMLSAAVTFVGACVFRIIWVYTVFASVGTLESLYVSYPISWILSTAAHIVCYYIIRKKPFKATLEAKAAAA